MDAKQHTSMEPSPSAAARDPDTVQMHLLFDYLPAGVLFQLIAENHNETAFDGLYRKYEST